MNKILIVDDDARLLSTLHRLLEATGQYEVMTEDSGRRAVATAETFKPDVIILDMNMPGMGGVEFLKNISTPDGKLRYPVLVMTSRANMEKFFDSVAVQGFVTKPCDPNDLRAEIDRIVANTGVAQKTILVGEDDPAVRERLLAAFRNAGYVAEGVAGGPQLLEKAILAKPAVIVVKLILTGLNGDAVARTLNGLPNTRSIPVVLYGGRKDAEEVPMVEPLKPGVSGFVRGDHTKDLLTAVAEVLAK